MLVFTHVTKQYPDGIVAIRDVSLEIPSGQFCVLLGSSGAGKSTLLRLVNGLLFPTEGSVSLAGEKIERRSLRQLQPTMAMIHQQFNLVPRLNVLDNVLSGTLPRLSWWRALLRWFSREQQRKACRLIAEVGLGEEHLYRRAMDLSGGQEQRVAIARAFILNPTVVLADEPVASLDPKTSRTILHLLKHASRQRNVTVLCSLHQVDLAMEFADRIVGIDTGVIVFDGRPEAFDKEAHRELYREDDQTSEHIRVGDSKDSEPSGSSGIVIRRTT
ncbi:MAG: phosphonate ABC transporter ATP-binding protein [Gemmataceae bacterium]